MHAIIAQQIGRTHHAAAHPELRKTRNPVGIRSRCPVLAQFLSRLGTFASIKNQRAA